MSSSIDEAWVTLHLPEGTVSISGSGEWFVEPEGDETDSVMLNPERIKLIEGLETVLANGGL
jgi:hypothetical protein